VEAVTLVAVSRGTWWDIERSKTRMDWKFKWVSSAPPATNKVVAVGGTRWPPRKWELIAARGKSTAFSTQISADSS
jgi:Bacterial protein of unknown function (DUF899)